MRKRLLGAALVAITALAITACGSRPANSGGPSTAVKGNPGATVNIGFGLEPTGLDPTKTAGAAVKQLVTGNVYEGLVSRGQDGTISPLLADSWTISDDRLVYTFKLHQGVTFQDGSAFDSADAVASLQASSAPKSLNPDAKLMSTVKSVAAPDASTVVLTLTKPNINILDALATSAGLIVPSDNKVDLSKQSNGTGPYTIGQWNTGSTITLTRNDKYWGTPAGTKEVVFHYYADATAAGNALASGEVDVLTFSNAETINRFKNDPSYTLSQGSDTSWMTLGFNNANPALADQRVRSAIRKAIDKQGLIDALGGNMVRIGSMTSPADPWWDQSLNSIDAYDPQAARTQLAQAGQSNLTLNLRVADTYDKAISEYVAAQLGKVGITVNIQTMQFASWLDDVYTKKNYDMTIVLHVDPWTLTYYGNPAYYWNYNNPAVTDAVNAALGSATIADRNDKLRQVARLVSQDAASDWLYSPITQIISKPGISGFPTSRTGTQFPVAGIQVAG